MAALTFVVALPPPAAAQTFAPGQTVEASPLAMQSQWRTCTVNGRTPGGDYDVKCGGIDYVVQPRWVRASQAGPAPAANPAPQATPAPAPPPPPAQQTDGDRANCPPDGTVVRDRYGNVGPITGVVGGFCRYLLPDGSSRSALAWLLAPADVGPAAPAGGGALTNGAYSCDMSAGGGTFPITILSGSQYSDRAGQSGAYAVQGNKVTFTSGSLAGQYSEILGPGKFGLSTKFNGMFYGVCNLR